MSASALWREGRDVTRTRRRHQSRTGRPIRTTSPAPPAEAEAAEDDQHDDDDDDPVPIYEWGADAAPDEPAPYATTIQVPISDTGPVAEGGQVTVQVTATDRVANEVTVEDTIALAATPSDQEPTPGTTSEESSTDVTLPATGGGTALVALVVLAVAMGIAGRRRRQLEQ